MANKRIIFGIGLLVAAAIAIGVFLIEKKPLVTENTAIDNTIKKEQAKISVKPTLPVKKNSVKSDLYTDSTYYMPFDSIAEIANLKPEIKEKVNNILDSSQGFYFLKQNSQTKEIIILLQNAVDNNSDRYMRHNLQLVKISDSGEVTYNDVGYSGNDDESDNAILQKNDEWEFDTSTEPYRPIKHTAYDKRKKVKFVETWNYDDSEPVKYEMKDSKGNVVSIMKESLDSDSNFRKEHIFYDSEGKTVKSLSANYDGANIKWFTYYDAQTPDENVTIESVYDNGLKTEEKLYNQEFKLVKTIKASYADDERTSITVLDSEGKEVQNIEKE